VSQDGGDGELAFYGGDGHAAAVLLSFSFT
jgi:hypothetical protein